MNLIYDIESAFKDRVRPTEVIPYLHPNTSEYEEAGRFKGVNWKDLDVEFLDRNSDALYAFTPIAFCYYLPSFLIAGLCLEPKLPAFVSTVVNMLDRTPDIKLWDDFFYQRWRELTINEYKVVREWLVVLSSTSIDYFFLNQLSRAFDTMQLLIDFKD